MMNIQMLHGFKEPPVLKTLKPRILANNILSLLPSNFLRYPVLLAPTLS